MRYLILAVLIACGAPTDNRAIPPNEPALAVSAANLRGLDVVVIPSTVYVGEHAQGCAYFRFLNGKAAMRSQDAPGCSKDFVERYSLSTRTITAARQRFVDGTCIAWSSSADAVATVRNDACALAAQVGGFVLASR